MIKREFSVSDNMGKYTKQIIAIIEIACQLKSNIRVELGDKKFNAKSIMRIGEIQTGDSFSLVFDGEDEAIEADKFERFFRGETGS